MRAEPDDLHPADLAEVLWRGWGIPVAASEYVAVGGGSHHWRVLDVDAKAHWLTADALKRTSLAALRLALQTAVALRDRGGLEFVVSPIPTLAGDSLRPLGRRYAFALYPYLGARPLEFGLELNPAAAAQLAGLLGRLHAADRSLGAGLREVGAELPGRAALEVALRELGEPWTGGPFSEPARQEVARHQAAVRGLLRLFDDLCGTVDRYPGQHVITHGEPHPANLLLDGDRLLLIDWDTVGIAAPERDLWWLDGQPAALELYERAAGRKLEPSRMHLYRVRWTLDDIVTFVRMFRSPHQRNPDTERWWSFAGRLTQAVESAARARLDSSSAGRP